VLHTCTTTCGRCAELPTRALKKQALRLAFTSTDVDQRNSGQVKSRLLGASRSVDPDNNQLIFLVTENETKGQITKSLNTYNKSLQLPRRISNINSNIIAPGEESHLIRCDDLVL
jgi:hypothetical protein